MFSRMYSLPLRERPGFLVPDLKKYPAPILLDFIAKLW
jgi:hypothetical protein